MSRSLGRAPGFARAPRRLLFAFAVVTSWSSSPLRAADARSNVTLDIEEAARRAADASPLVRRARAQLDAVAARKVEADLLLPSNPVVAASAGPTFTDATSNAPNVPSSRVTGMTAHLEQTIEVAGQRGTRRNEVARAIDAARLRARVAENESRARARTAYVAALLAAAQLEAAKRLEELATKLEGSVETRVATGAASDIDLRLATLERSRIQRDRLELVQAAGDALSDLRHLLALPPETHLALSTPLAAPAGDVPALEQALASARERRAELQALDAERGELDAALVRLGREALPSPTVFVDVERDRPGELFARAGIAIPLPFARRKQGEVAATRAARASVDVERTLGEAAVVLEVERAWREARNRRAQVEIDEKLVVPSAEAALDLLTQGWRSGKFDLFRIIQASRDAGDARRRALEDLGRLWQARIELDRTMGAS
ncbi:MAG TPA: TolC family protein [Polyangia bacterium]|jgi:cobalt-zinc-cadmium efflux system outer membrane protein|nr:TolC family protein [Polyangia bacterium]